MLDYLYRPVMLGALLILSLATFARMADAQEALVYARRAVVAMSVVLAGLLAASLSSCESATYLRCLALDNTTHHC